VASENNENTSLGKYPCSSKVL